MTGYGVRAVAVLAAAVLLSGCGGKEKHGPEAPVRLAVSGVEMVTVQPVPRETSVEAMGTVRAKEEIGRAIAQAEASKELAEKTHDRYRMLLDEKVVTPQEYDEVALRRTVAVKEHERSLQRAAQAAGRLAQAKGSADAARALAGYAKVTAPFSGVVIEKKADAGSMAVPGVPLFVLEDPRRHRIEASVSEAYLPMLKTGSPVSVLLDDAPDMELPASVSEIVPAIDPATRTFVVKAELPPRGRSAPSWPAFPR